MSRDIEAEPTAEAEADDADRTIHRVVSTERLHGAGAIEHGLLPVDGLHGTEGHAQSIRSLERAAILQSPIGLGDEDDVAEGGQILCPPLDVGADAEDLLEEHDARASARFRQPEMGRHRQAVVGGHGRHRGAHGA